uniref:Uncharacterized protein n=1 Tax=Glossina palpalis gambiensis TaxID=67801 RepID=A0A1B0BHH3_9MUSC
MTRTTITVAVASQQRTETYGIVTYREVVLQLSDRWALDEVVQFLHNNLRYYLKHSSYVKGSRMASYATIVWCGIVDDVSKFLNGAGCVDKSDVWFAPVELGPSKQGLE